VVGEQSGVFRINCLDSIDRTNVAMSTISATVFQAILKQAGIDIKETFGAEAEKKGFSFVSVPHKLIEEYKFYWRDKGD